MGCFEDYMDFRTESGLIPASSEAGYSPYLWTNNYIRQQRLLTNDA